MAPPPGAPAAPTRFNAAQIKRQAHTLSRRDTEQRWNLFRHVSWDKRNGPLSKTGTWNGPDLEAQAENDQAGNGDGSPITHANTVPTVMSSAGAEPTNDSMNNPADPRLAGADGQESSSKGQQRRQGEQSNVSEGTYVDSPASQFQGWSAASTDEGLRARTNKQQEQQPQDAEASAAAEEKDDKKDKKPRFEGRLFHGVKPKKPFTVANQLQRTLLSSWINILLVAAPVGIALNYVHGINGIAIFVVNFLAIIPLAAMLSFATEEIALRTGETLGGLLNATFGNAVEFIVAVLALIQNKVLIVQTSLIGSVLSNLLLVMGMCFFFGGLRRQEQFFNTTVAQTAASLLALAVAGVIIPTVFDQNTNSTSNADIAKLSRGTALILLIVYGSYLLFQLKTHADVFAEESKKVPAKPFKRELPQGAIARGMVKSAGLVGAGAFSELGDSEALNKVLNSAPGNDDDDDDEENDPKLHFLVAVATLAGSTIIIAFCAEFMVDGISAVTAGGVVSEEFVGLILLPIVGNAAEHVTAVTVAIKDKMDLAIGVAVGSSMQVALFLIPLLVVIGWGLGNEGMTLSFDMFQVAVLFVSVLLVNYLISDGKSHWLEGLLLMCLYCIIAVCSWWYPAKGVAG